MMALNERKTVAPSRSDSTSTVDSFGFDMRGSSPLSEDAASNTPFENNAMKRQLYKTKICRHNLVGRCKYNENCFFAHAADQIVPRIDFRKTKLCSKANCNDSDCLYAHSVVEIRDPYAPLCPEWSSSGKCKNGSACKLSHNLTHVEELALTARGKISKHQTPKLYQPSRETTPATNCGESLSSSGLLTPPSLASPPPTPMLFETTGTPDLSTEDLVRALMEMLSGESISPATF